MVSLTSQIDKLPVHCINASNLQRYGAEINQNILESQLISIDLEMSGLGDMQKKKGGSNDINVRYSAIKEATEEFGIISLGISCFKSNDMQSDTNICYSCNAYSFLICSSEKISFNFKSANFLSSHDFDFNELFTNAILYQPAFLPTNPEENPKKSIKDDEYQNEKLLNQFISNIFQNCKKICFHNGFIDMMFIYSHFFCRLPSNLNTFVQDITVLCG
ncbi:MAG: Target of EGR1, member 1 (Nuclear), variant 2, partial [Marteilia pararefringens]